MPGVVLLGPRQVGKTTLARVIASATVGQSLYLDLEDPANLRRLDDPGTFLRAQAGKLLVLDEIHRCPELFNILRGVIDERRANGEGNGQFLLLGSAAMDLMRQASESLAGRVSYVELGSFDALEVPETGTAPEQLWTRGGFPESFLAADDGTSLIWRRDFIRSYLERDVPMFAPRLPAASIRRLWSMLAHAQGTPLNTSRLASSLAVSSAAVTRYIDLLVDLLLIRRLQPWSANVGKRLVRSPKLFLRDSGLTHALLDLESWEDILGHAVVGASWEGFVIENCIAAAGDRRTPYFFRTESGAEIDLLLERGGEIEFAIEIKRSSAPAISRGFFLACDALSPRHRYVIHSGSDSWPMRNGVTAISLPDMMERLLA
jgi:predicted AAA+ superfamily ATPase